MFWTLETYVKCKVCSGDVWFGQCGLRGLGFKVCVSCTAVHRCIDSCPKVGTGYEINRRFVYVIGVGLHGKKLFCGLMDLGIEFNANIFYKVAPL